MKLNNLNFSFWPSHRELVAHLENGKNVVFKIKDNLAGSHIQTLVKESLKDMPLPKKIQKGKSIAHLTHSTFEPPSLRGLMVKNAQFNYLLELFELVDPEENSETFYQLVERAAEVNPHETQRLLESRYPRFVNEAQVLVILGKALLQLDWQKAKLYFEKAVSRKEGLNWLTFPLLEEIKKGDEKLYQSLIMLYNNNRSWNTVEWHIERTIDYLLEKELINKPPSILYYDKAGQEKIFIYLLEIISSLDKKGSQKGRDELCKYAAELLFCYENTYGTAQPLNDFFNAIATFEKIIGKIAAFKNLRNSVCFQKALPSLLSLMRKMKNSNIREMLFHEFYQKACHVSPSAITEILKLKIELLPSEADRENFLDSLETEYYGSFHLPGFQMNLRPLFDSARSFPHYIKFLKEHNPRRAEVIVQRAFESFQRSALRENPKLFKYLIHGYFQILPLEAVQLLKNQENTMNVDEILIELFEIG